MVSFVMLTIAP